MIAETVCDDSDYHYFERKFEAQQKGGKKRIDLQEHMNNTRTASGPRQAHGAPMQVWGRDGNQSWHGIQHSAMIQAWEKW